MTGSIHFNLSQRVLLHGRKEDFFLPARLIWNNVWVEQCDISAMTSCQGML